MNKLLFGTSSPFPDTHIPSWDPFFAHDYSWSMWLSLSDHPCWKGIWPSKCERKNFDTFLNLENYEPLRLPWKIRKKLKSQAAASYLTAMNALQVEKTWCTSLWRKISLRSKQWQQIPRKPWGIQPSTEIVDAPSGWSNLALTMIDFRMVKPCLKNQAVNWDTEAQTPEANYWCFFAIA